MLLRFTNDTFDHDVSATIGKSISIATSFQPGELTPGSLLTGVDFKVKTVVLGGKRVKLSIWVSIRSQYGLAQYGLVNMG